MHFSSPPPCSLPPALPPSPPINAPNLLRVMLSISSSQGDPYMSLLGFSLLPSVSGAMEYRMVFFCFKFNIHLRVRQQGITNHPINSISNNVLHVPLPYKDLHCVSALQDL